MSNAVWSKVPTRLPEVALRSRSTIQRPVGHSPHSLPRNDSLTDFLKDHAVTSLPPIDLINRFRFSSPAKPLVSVSHRFEKPKLRTLRAAARRNRFKEFATDMRSLSPETVRSVARSALKPLSKAQLDVLPLRVGSSMLQEILSYSPRPMEHVVTVRSHLRHY